jgi:hypothetical protein
MSGPITFADFVPGAVMGETTLVFEPALAQAWQSIFGDTPADGAGGAAEGASLAVVMMMRAYLSVVAPRPPGNVHARQRLRLSDTPRGGESIRTVVTCVAKEIRRERRYVALRACGTGDGGRAVYDGHMTLVWAA